MKKIVVLDGFTLNPGDLSWEGLAKFGEYSVYDRTPPGQVLERSANAEIILTNKTILNNETIAKLDKLQYIGVMATGYNVVDTEAAKNRNIPVTNVPEYGTKSVAQMTFALILELTNHVGHHSNTVREGRWQNSIDFCYWDFPLIELDGLTLGIIGYGRIGRAVAEIADVFGLKVIVNDSNPESCKGREFAGLDEIFSRSDIVSLHCPLTPENKGFVNSARLSLMKPEAFLINTGRGPLVNENDLAEALNIGKIAGAGLDVLSVEPPEKTNPLITAKNCIITPHISWATYAARKRLMNTVMKNIEAFIEGHPVNVLNF